VISAKCWSLGEPSVRYLSSHRTGNVVTLTKPHSSTSVANSAVALRSVASAGLEFSLDDAKVRRELQVVAFHAGDERFGVFAADA
jgi:hypothetical protein